LVDGKAIGYAQKGRRKEGRKEGTETLKGSFCTYIAYGIVVAGLVGLAATHVVRLTWRLVK